MGAETLWGDTLAAPSPTLVAGTNDLVSNAPAVTLVGGTNDAVLTVPAPTLVAEDNSLVGALVVPTPTLTGTITSAATGAIDKAVPAPTLSASGVSGTRITVVSVVPAPLLVATLVNPAVITAAIAVPPPIVVSTGVPGTVITAVLTAVTPILSASGYPAYTIAFAGTTPAPVLSAYSSEAIAATYRTWVLNTRNRALTEYDSFAFNSFAVFNGYVLAAGASGVVTLGTQSLDNAATITARVRTGKESFGSSVHKRAPRIYTGLVADGDMIFRTITNEGGTRSYLLGWNHATGLQQRRVPVGKGPRSRFWSFEIENVAGADFSVNDILVQPVALRRRTQ